MWGLLLSVLIVLGVVWAAISGTTPLERDHMDKKRESDKRATERATFLAARELSKSKKIKVPQNSPSAFSCRYKSDSSLDFRLRHKGVIIPFDFKIAQLPYTFYCTKVCHNKKLEGSYPDIEIELFRCACGDLQVPHDENYRNSSDSFQDEIRQCTCGLVTRRRGTGLEYYMLWEVYREPPQISLTGSRWRDQTNDLRKEVLGDIGKKMWDEDMILYMSHLPICDYKGVPTQVVWVTGRSLEMTIPGGTYLLGRVIYSNRGRSDTDLLLCKKIENEGLQKILWSFARQIGDAREMALKESIFDSDTLEHITPNVHDGYLHGGSAVFITAFRESEAAQAAFDAGIRTKRYSEQWWEWSALGKIQELHEQIPE